MLGGIVAGVLYELIFSADASLKKAKSFLFSSRTETEEDNSDVSQKLTAEKEPEEKEAYELQFVNSQL